MKGSTCHKLDKSFLGSTTWQDQTYRNQSGMWNRICSSSHLLLSWWEHKKNSDLEMLLDKA